MQGDSTWCNAAVSRTFTGNIFSCTANRRYHRPLFFTVTLQKLSFNACSLRVVFFIHLCDSVCHSICNKWLNGIIAFLAFSCVTSVKYIVPWLWCADEPRETESTLFDQLEEEESKRLMSLPPSNAFEEMIRWTEEGKLWTFPIDNEQGTVTFYCCLTVLYLSLFSCVCI